MKNRLFNVKDKKWICNCEEKGVERDFEISIFFMFFWF